MAQYFLINNIRGGANGDFVAGITVDDDLDDVTLIRTLGGLLVSTSNGRVALAAERAKVERQRGAPRALLESIMQCAYQETEPEVEWTTQDTWYIDPVNGDDKNVGNTTTTALKTLTEWNRRIATGEVSVFMVVNILGDLPESINFKGSFTDNGFLLLRGQSAILHSGTITASQAWDVSTFTPGWIEDSALGASWTASQFTGLKGKVVFPDRDPGFTGTYPNGWVMIDQGTSNHRARLSPVLDMSSSAILVPSVGEQYQVHSIPRLNGFFFNAACGAQGLLAMADLIIGNDSQTSSFFLEQGQCFNYGCAFVGFDCGLRGAAVFGDFVNCRIFSRFSSESGQAECEGCLFVGIGRPPSAKRGASLLMSNSVGQGPGTELIASVGGVAQINPNTFYATCDGDFASIIDEGSTGIFEGDLVGINPSTTTLIVRKTGQIAMKATGSISGNGTPSAEVNVAGVDIDYATANVDYIDPATGTRIIK